MAELEVAKHGKNVIKMAASKEHGLADKLKEIALEVAIIVFAVSVSIWFHSLSEHRHEQKQVKAFLLGLKADLTRDIKDLEFVIESHKEGDALYKTMMDLDPKAAPDGENFDRQFLLADSNRWFVPVNSRFEGFKSGGKLTNIEDEVLLNQILSLYQYGHAAIRTSESGWLGRQNKLRDYLDRVLEHDDSRQQRYRAMTSAAGKRYMGALVTSEQMYQRYAAAIAQSKKIIDRIDVLYKEN